MQCIEGTVSYLGSELIISHRKCYGAWSPCPLCWAIMVSVYGGNNGLYLALCFSVTITAA